MATAKAGPTGRSGAHPGPFAEFFVIWTGGTLVLLLIVLASDPSSFASNWPMGLIVGGGIWGIWCFVGYMVEGRGYGLWFWRKMH